MSITSYIDPGIHITEGSAIAWLTSNVGVDEGKDSGHTYLFLERNEPVGWCWGLLGYSSHIIERVDYVGKVIHEVYQGKDSLGALQRQEKFKNMHCKTQKKRQFTVSADQLHRLHSYINFAKANPPTYDRYKVSVSDNKHNCASALVTLLEKAGIGAGTVFTKLGWYIPSDVSSMTLTERIKKYFGSLLG